MARQRAAVKPPPKKRQKKAETGPARRAVFKGGPHDGLNVEWCSPNLVERLPIPHGLDSAAYRLEGITGGVARYVHEPRS